MAQDSYNAEHYADSTAWSAMHMYKRDCERDKYHTALSEAKKIFRQHGFDVIGRVSAVSRKTGRVF